MNVIIYFWWTRGSYASVFVCLFVSWMLTWIETHDLDFSFFLHVSPTTTKSLCVCLCTWIVCVGTRFGLCSHLNWLSNRLFGCVKYKLYLIIDNTASHTFFPYSSSNCMNEKCVVLMIVRQTKFQISVIFLFDMDFFLSLSENSSQDWALYDFWKFMIRNWTIKLAVSQ